MKFIVLTVGLALISCSKKSSTSGNQAAADQTVKLGSFEYKVSSQHEVSTAFIENLVYEATTHSLKLSINYPGCTETSHSLIYSEVCAESYPSQCGAAITHEAGFDSSCEAAHHEVMTVALTDPQNGMVLTVVAKDGKGTSVLIDRDGSVKAATTPP